MKLAPAALVLAGLVLAADSSPLRATQSAR